MKLPASWEVLLAVVGLLALYALNAHGLL